MTEPMSTVPFLGFRLASCTAAGFIEGVMARAEARAASFTVAYFNAATVNMAFADAEQARRMAAFDYIYADGMAVVWAARKLGGAVPERVNAGDFTPEFMRAMAARGLKLALVGGRAAGDGKPAEADAAAAIFRGWAPGLEIVFTHHGFYEAAEAVRAQLEEAAPDVVMLGMGSPRQEIAALDWAGRGAPRVWWCVGALFEYYAGTRWRAPVWIRRIGMEWLVRLVLEPGRLWRRYVIGNPVFIWRVMRGKAPKGIINGNVSKSQ